MSGQICVTAGTPQCLMDLRFSPDGSQVVGVRAATETSGSAIWVANSDGTSARQLVAPDYGDHDPTWAPDGRSVLFVRVVRVDHRCVGNGGSVTNALESVEVETGARSAIVAPDVCWIYENPEWSTDRTRIITGGYHPSGSALASLWWVNPQTGGRTAITALQGFDNARFSPDGSMIVAGENRYFRFPTHAEIRVVDAANPGTTIFSQLPQQGGGIRIQPTFTPDGKSISWGDCRPQCGVYSRLLPTPDTPDTPIVQDITGRFPPNRISTGSR